jgi:RND family efflux transporter MFP subunit
MMASLARLSRRQKIAIVVFLVLCSATVLGAARLVKRTPSLPTFLVKREDFLDTLDLRGEVKALTSVSITAPAEAGDLQILKISNDGAQVKKGEVVVEFDRTKTEQDLAQFRSTLKSAEAEIEQAKAQARMAEEADTTQMMKSRYDVERAKLEASKQEIVSRIQGAEAGLKLADAEQQLKESEQKLKSDQSLNRATIESKIQASRKAAYDAERAARSLTKLTLQAPISGMITLVQVERRDGEAPFKPGDQAWAGAPIAEIPDLSTLRVSARVDETERGRLRLNQPVTVQLDAIPDRQFTGHLDKISTLASTDFSGGWPFPRNFALVAQLDQPDPRLRPGMTSQLTIIVDRVPAAIAIPAQACFQRSGATVAYVWARSKFEERVIEVGRRSGGRALVAKGLEPGDQVALQDPTTRP